MLYLFHAPDHQERDVKVSVQVPHLLKLMARWRKRTLLQIRRLNALFCSTGECLKMFYNPGAQSWQHPQASLFWIRLTSRSMNDPEINHVINIKPQ